MADMISFYPGPSKVDECIPEYVKSAHQKGILSINHRSTEFMDLSAKCKAIVKDKLDIPDDYEVFFVSSATECWEIITEQFDGFSYHFYNGSFGEKWFNSAKKLKKEVIGYAFDCTKELRLGELDLSMEPGTICITQNETSNGTAVSNKRLAKIRKSYPDHIIAVDGTSSMAGQYLKFKHADIWFASVQKCFGIPAGSAVLICSPKAIEKAIANEQNSHYNSLSNIIHHGRKNQTTHTPNIMAIYLLYRVIKERQDISKIDNILSKRLTQMEDMVRNKTELQWLIPNDKVKSKTVWVLKSSDQNIERIKEKARSKGIILGNGYGEWNSNTFRVANFPAISQNEMAQLFKFLEKNIA